MLMLTAFMDETGHSKDERQRFNGMAGLLATGDDWEQFERQWKVILDEYKIPFFHMKDFANRKQFFKGWDEAKRRELLDKLLKTVRAANALPIGSILPMEDFRQLTAKCVSAN